MKALIEIDVAGEFCDCCPFVGAMLGLKRQYECKAWAVPLVLNPMARDTHRCPDCLAATARAQELLDAEAELKRMKDAETYENEMMP